MASATMTSRILGMVREMVYSRFMGDGWVAGAFQVAFTMPNLFRRLLGEGALTAAFIPIFKEKEKQGPPAEMWRAANAVISGLVVSAAAIIGLVLIGVSLALQFGEFEARMHLMLSLLRVMFPYMLLVCVTAVFMGILNARGHFFIPAMGATLLNVVMIASVLFLAPRMGRELYEQIYALAIGVLVAGVAQAAFQVPSLRREGFRYAWVSPWQDETVRRVVGQMIPGTIGVAAFQINVVIIQNLGLWLDTPQSPVIAPFNYAVRLLELPQGVFGMSVATYLLPTLAGLAVEKNYGEFRGTLRKGMEHLLWINLLAAILLAVLAEPIIRLLFEGRRFGPDATLRAAWALQCLAPGLVAYSLVNVLARAFFALGDTKAPMQISLVCLALNLVLSIFLVQWFRQGGLGMANTLSSAVNCGLLVFALRRKLKRLDFGALRGSLGGLAAAGGVAVALAWGLSRGWEMQFGHAALPQKLGAVFVPAVLVALVYWGVTLALKVPSAKEVTEAALARLRRRK